MQRNLLIPGDILRFGSLDIRFRDSASDGVATHAPRSNHPGSMGLKPISEEVHVPPFHRARPRPDSSRPATGPDRSASPGGREPASPTEDPRRASKTQGRQPQDDELHQAGEKRSPAPSSPQPSSPQTREALPQEPAAVTAELVITPEEAVPSDPITDRVRAAMRSQQRRPGEEDPLRSPLVLGLAGGAAALLLTGAIFYFIATRQTAQQAFDAAKHYFDEGNYRSSIEAMQEFLADYPRHALTVSAQRVLGQSRVRQLIDSAAPKYPEGLDQLRAFIDEQRDTEGFESLHQNLVNDAKTIALGAAVAAGKAFDPKLLDVSTQATTILKTYAPKDVPPTETLDQIDQAQRISQAAILRDDVYLEQLTAIDQALERQDPLSALQRRRDLLVRYPEFKTDQRVGERLRLSLESERNRVKQFELDVSATTSDHPTSSAPLTLAFQGRTRTDEVPIGKAVLFTGQDCCYGLEFATGQPLWRRVIGYGTPFLPIQESATPSILAYDTNHHELIRLHLNTGKLIWRQSIPSGIIGKPLVSSEDIYVSTGDARILAIDLAQGRITDALKFSQSVGSPVELGDEQRLAVAGDEEVLYSLTRRPLECDAVFDLGHRRGSIKAPLLAMAGYLLAIENGTQQSMLHLLQVGSKGSSFAEVATAPVRGLVVDAPVVRGRDLFVPSSGERVSAFSLSDDPGQPPLTAGPTYQGASKVPGPIFLLPGPDRQLWMVSSALAKMRLTTNALQLDGNPVASGVATQPLQYISGFLFNARRPLYTDALTATRTDRDELTSDWQVTIGGRILDWTATPGNSLNVIALTSAGQTYRIGTRQFSESPFLTQAAARLPLPRNLSEPLLAGGVSNHRLAVVCGGTEPQLWLVNSAGQIESTRSLPAVPQAAPCPLGDDVLVPLAGRMHVVRGVGRSPVQDYTLPTGDVQKWVSLSLLPDLRVAAVTSAGSIIQLRINDTAPAHLGEVSRVELKQTVRFPSVSDEKSLAVADTANGVSLFDKELELLGKKVFKQNITGPPLLASNRLFVEVGGRKLVCLKIDDQLTQAWELDLPETGVAGILGEHGHFLIALRSGIVLTVAGQDGQVLNRLTTGNTLTRGPLAAGGSLFVATADGSILRLPKSEREPAAP
jgi:outer membrane protein assembly factor BamB